MCLDITIKIQYWQSWFTSNKTELVDYLHNKYDYITFVDEPISVEKTEKKPFEVFLDDKLIYSNLKPINNEKGPVLFSTNKWWGEPDPENIERIENAILDV
jgi:hypothetical protein